MADVEVRILELMDRGYPVELTLNFVQHCITSAPHMRVHWMKPSIHGVGLEAGSRIVQETRSSGAYGKR